MRIIRFIADDGRTMYGEAAGGDDWAIIHSGSIAEGFKRTQERAQIKKLLAPLQPRDIICIGRNYQDRSSQPVDQPRSADPGYGTQSGDATLEVFLKPSFSLQHPNDPILVPHFPGIEPQLDCEGELAVVIGKPAHNVKERDALNHVFGYTIANDVTARHFQTKTGPPLWMRGKGFPTFCPLGPAIVTTDEIADPQSLSIRTIISGRIVRDGNARDMIRSVAQIVAALSGHLLLQPGTVVLTGAPPPLAQSFSLNDGDVASIEIAAIGSLSNCITSALR